MKRSGNPFEPLPAALRQAVQQDHAPVAFLALPWRRALLLALPTVAALASAFLILELRGGAMVFSIAGGGVSVLEWLGGLGLLWLALREAVPGLGIGAGRSALAIVAGVVLQFGLGLLIWQRAGAAAAGSGAIAIGTQCATIEGMIGLPHLAIATWLALRAFPLRPRWSGALAGASAGLLADSVWHLACARNDLEHLLVWHLGATVAMAGVGAFAGLFRSRQAGSIR